MTPVTARGQAARVARAAFERMPAGVRDLVRGNVAAVSGLGQLKRNQAVLASQLATLAPPEPPSSVPDGRFPDGVRSRICSESQLREPWFAAWSSALGEQPRANRKLWEHAYIAHALDALGCLQPGRRGLGFGVGREPLVSVFARQGCQVVATDQPVRAEGARSWANTGQHAYGLAALNRRGLCEPARFRAAVTFRQVDMRSVPTDLVDFDFCWSACSLEHLGTLDAGMAFVERSLATLCPGGIAVHTTELNVSSDTATIAKGHTVLYRRSDLQALAQRLEGAGHEVAALDLASGHGVLDTYVDVPPYVDAPHLRLLYRNFVTTSVALVVRRRGSS